MNVNEGAQDFVDDATTELKDKIFKLAKAAQEKDKTLKDNPAWVEFIDKIDDL